MNSAKHLKIAETITNLLDRQFSIFGYRFGLDPIIGLLPIAGDTIPFLIGCYIIWIGYQNRLPNQVLGKMIAYLCLDLLIGSVPVLGNLGDFVFKAHQKNLELLKAHLRNP